MCSLGLGFMIEEGRVRRTIHVALKDMGKQREIEKQSDVK